MDVYGVLCVAMLHSSIVYCMDYMLVLIDYTMVLILINVIHTILYVTMMVMIIISWFLTKMLWFKKGFFGFFGPIATKPAVGLQTHSNL
jgi:hypothetical protein